MISLDVKSLNTNVSLKEAIVIVLRILYEQDEPPSIARRLMKRLLNMAVSQVHFKCNETWYVQKDYLAMGASLAVIFSKSSAGSSTKLHYRGIFPEMFLPEKDLNGICPEQGARYYIDSIVRYIDTRYRYFFCLRYFDTDTRSAFIAIFDKNDT